MADLYKSELYLSLQDRNEDTPKEIAKLIENGADINLKCDYNRTYLHYISDCYQSEVDSPTLIPLIYIFSNAGIDKNAQDNDGNTALHVAAEKEDTYQLVRAMITVGLDPNLKNNEEHTADDLATDALVKKTFQVLQPGLWKAIDDGDDEAILRCIGSWCKIDDKRKGKRLIDVAELVCGSNTVKLLETNLPTCTLVHSTLARDKKKMKKALKRRNADVNTRNETYISFHGKRIAMPLIGEAACLHLIRPVKILLEHGADVNLRVDESQLNSDPLFLHLMRELPGIDAAFDVIEMIVESSDFSLIPNPAVIFTLAFDRQYPGPIIKRIQEKGGNIFHRDEIGFTLRDRIYLENYALDEELLRQKLAFVDNIVINFACEGDIEFLENLALNSYDCDAITDKDGKTIQQVVEEKGIRRSITFVANLPELQKTIRRLHQSVQYGYYKDVKELMNDSLSTCKDKGGRSLLHKAVLFERRHIIKYLLLNYPNTLHVKDTGGRTALHWAMCLKDGTDIEDALVKAGAKRDEPDKNGKTPADYKRRKEEFSQVIEKERLKDYGIDVYLFQKYMQFKHAILKGDLRRVEDIRNFLYKDVDLNRIHKDMYQIQPPPRDLLSICIDKTQDKIGKYLLTQGLDWSGKYVDETTGDKKSTIDAAKDREMTNMVEYIDYLKSRKDENVKTTKKIVEKNDVILKEKLPEKVDIEPIRVKDPEKTEKESCACVVL